MRNRIAVVLLALCLHWAAWAQSPTLLNDSRTFYEADLRYGKFLPFDVENIPSVYGLDLKIGRQTDGRAAWERDFNYLSYGVFFRYSTNNMDSVKYVGRDENGYERATWEPLGDCYSLGGFLNGHFYRGKYWSLDYGLMGGLSFWTRYGNIIIGSVANVHLSMEVGPTVRVGNQFDLLLRYQLSHTSNAALRLPNRGTNALCWQVGLRYHPNGRPELVPKAKPRPAFQKYTSLFATETVGILQTNEWMRSHQTADGTMVSDLPFERPYYFADQVQLGLHRQFHPKFSYDVAFDLCWTGETKRMYEKAHQMHAEGHEYFTGDNPIPLIEYGFGRSLHLATSFLFEVNYNRFAFCIGGAYYLWHSIYHGTDQKKTWGLAESSESHFENTYLPPCYRTFYERMGFKYYMGERRNLFAGCFMKVHSGVIDYAEFTFGINLFGWEDKK